MSIRQNGIDILVAVVLLTAAIGCEVSADYDILGPDEVAQTLPQPPPSPRELRFKELDTDGDDRLSLEEFSKGRKAEEAAHWFGLRDVDDDDSVSLAEFLPPVPISSVEPSTSTGK